MGRDHKVGLDYFSLDTDILADPKTEFLIAEHGLLGFAIFIQLLTKIYRNGYYLKWTEREAKIYRSKVNVNINELDAIINTMIAETIFDNDNHKAFNVLTSKGIQKRYISACERRKKLILIAEYLLVDVDSMEKKPKEIIYVNIKGDYVDIKEFNVNKKPQSKVKKEESKVEESREDTPKFAIELREHFITANTTPEGIPFKVPSSFVAWDKTMRLMVEKDKRSIPQINVVIVFAANELKGHNNGEQYCFRVESPKSLREKYDKLLSKMNNEKKKESGSQKSVFDKYREEAAQQTINLDKGQDGIFKTASDN